MDHKCLIIYIKEFIKMSIKMFIKMFIKVFIKVLQGQYSIINKTIKMIMINKMMKI